MPPKADLLGTDFSWRKCQETLSVLIAVSDLGNSFPLVSMCVYLLLLVRQQLLTSVSKLSDLITRRYGNSPVHTLDGKNVRELDHLQIYYLSL